MQALLAAIRDGSFARDWIAENERGRPRFEAKRQSEREQPIERVGAELRKMMPFLDPVTVKPGD